MTITQAWHNAIVTRLLHSSCGDLILDNRGDLCTRYVWEDLDNYTKELPWAQHRPGRKLAIIGMDGWTLTREGANYILENSIFDRKDLKRLEQVAVGRTDAEINEHLHQRALAGVR